LKSFSKINNLILFLPDHFTYNKGKQTDGVDKMGAFAVDFVLLAIFIIGITALMGVILNGIGENIFGGKQRDKFFNRSARTQTGWKQVGGRK
jgi:hypothetical protein